MATRDELSTDTDFAKWLFRAAAVFNQTDPRGKWLSEKIRDLADEASLLRADSPADFNDKTAVMAIYGKGK